MHLQRLPWVAHCSIALAGIAGLVPAVPAIEHRRRFEASDVARLAALTSHDRSAIFFRGFTRTGLVRSGVFQAVEIPIAGRRRPRNAGDGLCRTMDRASPTLSRTAAPIAGSASGRSCRERSGQWDALTRAGAAGVSPADTEVAYVRAAGVFAISVKDGTERLLASLPLRVDGRPPPGSWILRSLEWPPHRAGLLANATICLPTGTPGECSEPGHVLALESAGSRTLARGWGAAASPVTGDIGYVTAGGIRLLDGSRPPGRRVAGTPRTLLSIPPFLREETGWSNVEWSPRGDRLMFSTVLDEEFNEHLYVVDLAAGRRRRILTHTSLDILAWR